MSGKVLKVGGHEIRVGDIVDLKYDVEFVVTDFNRNRISGETHGGEKVRYIVGVWFAAHLVSVTKPLSIEVVDDPRGN